MRSDPYPWAGRSAVLLLLVLTVALVPLSARAQLAPTGGHYAARSSDTGFAGAVNSQAGYSASVPLDLPGARGGLPVPVRIVYGGHSVGAAGLAWDVPLSFIRRDTTIARRRPVGSPDTPPVARELLSLVLDGQRTDLVPNGTSTAWVARRDGPQLEVRARPDGGWTLYDGDGLTYVFTTGSSQALADAGLWLLRDVTGPGGGKAHLDYSLGVPLPATGDPQGNASVSIDLARVSYNPSPGIADCYKNEIVLNYEPDPPARPALSVSMLGSTVLARVHKLASVDVTSRVACGDARVALRTYQFSYQSDPDTDQPQLRSVTMIGEAGTPERDVTLPVATYTYGRATNVAGGLTYRRKQSLPIPSGLDARSLSSSFSDPRGKPPAAPEYSQNQGSVTWQSLVDTNGDGRPELTYLQGGNLFAVVNQSGFREQGNGGPVEFLGTLQLTGGPGSPLTAGALEMRSSDKGRTPLPGGYVFNTDMVWRQSIDVNGDGRLDLIDAKEEAGSWVVYLNTPGSPSAPGLVTWARRTISIAPLVQRLRAAGHTVSADHLPLSQRKTGSTVNHRTCWRWALDSTNPAGHWVHDIGGYATGQCIGPDNAVFSVAPENSFVEWEVTDINGDGYPDVLFDSTPIAFTNDDAPPPFINDLPTPGLFRGSARTESIRPVGTNAIMALFNVAGMHLGQGTNAFSSPVAITPPTTCSVERWSGSEEICGFADLNGDGLPDWGAFLNTGNLTGGLFTSRALVSLPGPVARHSVPQYQVCDGNLPAPLQTFQSSTTRALRDMNGDGIADFVAVDGQGAWHVSFGTGTRFGDARAIDVPNAQFALSQETENCGGTRSDTTRGLYDIDGDGQPEVVVLNPNGPSLDIYQLDAEGEQPNTGPVASRPMAGRLVAVANGYGAVTTIGYRSAKENGASHFLPFPEIVVTAVGTSDEFESALETPTLYAYGFAGLNFDPAYDAWVFPGYRRSVQLRITSDQVIPPPVDGVASVTDTYGLAGFDTGMNAEARFKRYMTTGRVRDVTVLAGNVGRDPWALLGIDAATDARRIAGTHYDWDARRLPAGATPTPPLFCLDLGIPYDFVTSGSDVLLHAIPDQCLEHGFVFQQAVDSWRGQPGGAPPSSNSVETRTEVVPESVDPFGRIGAVKSFNDVNRTDDDRMVLTTYATPAGTDARVLNAISTVAVARGFSGTPTVFHERWEYDTQPGQQPVPGTVSAGFVTAHVVSRLNAETGAGIPDEPSRDIRVFTATYDSAGNPAAVTATREDGATSTVTTAYDPFGLVPVSVKTDATNGDRTALPPLTTTVARDNLTLDALSVTDPNGTASGSTFDGFGRLLLSTVKPPGGAAGALSSVGYLGFAAGEGGGRRIVQKVFTDPVAPSSLATAAGRARTLFFDKLGRETRTELALGPDYAGQTLVAGSRLYDRLGRVQFEADPFLAGSSHDGYGTTARFNPDGTPSCLIRGKGIQPPTNVAAGANWPYRTDETSEVYPTCFRRVFARNSELLLTRDAASLLTGSPQAGVVRETLRSALGWILESETFTEGVGNGNHERARFGYDVLGHLISMTRFQDPGLLSGPIATTWHYDSLGQVLELDEPESAAQFRGYSNWGELIQTQWCDPTLPIASPCTDRRTISRYDALGRLTHSEDQTDREVDAETVHDFTYDRPATFVNRVQPSNVLGRLASASWPAARASFSYDAFGRLNARGFDNRHGNTFIEKHTYHGDGSPSALDLLLPDNGFKDERVDYTYDSAGRPRSVTYRDGTTSQALFSAPGAADIDGFGRIRRADYGPATFTASYADAGRRLLTGLKVTSPAHLSTSREITFPAIPFTSAGVTAFDPVGRERARVELKDGTASAATVHAYDALGRLISSRSWDAASRSTSGGWDYTYDPLGNSLAETDRTDSAQAGSVALSYSGTDRDRICRIGYGAGGLDGTECNLKYDGVGNIVEQPTRSNGTRKLSYLANGQVRRITDGGRNAASFGYDAFGAVQTLTLTSGVSPDTRNDRHFGPLITQRDEVVSGARQSVLTRSIPGPGGLIATRHGATGPWVFAFGESRGHRFSTDQTGAFVQDLSYQPYGEATSTGVQPGAQEYTSAQWNGGDALAALGVSQLGARIYDPVIGRFLSRDPLLIPRTAATTNPYAFAMNDPVNHSDPTGLDCGPEQIGCTPPPPSYGSGGGGSGDCPACNSNHHQPSRPGARPVDGTIVPLPLNRWAPLKPAGGENQGSVLHQWDGWEPFHPRDEKDENGKEGRRDGPDTDGTVPSEPVRLGLLPRAALVAALLAGSETVAVITASSLTEGGLVEEGSRHVVSAASFYGDPSQLDAAEVVLGRGENSLWGVRPNLAGGTVFESLTPVSGNPAHVEGIVSIARQQGQQVTMYSGYHQAPNGSIIPHQPFAKADARYYARYPNVRVIDTSDWTDSARAVAIQTTPGIVIVNTCYGGGFSFEVP